MKTHGMTVNTGISILPKKTNKTGASRDLCAKHEPKKSRSTGATERSLMWNHRFPASAANPFLRVTLHDGPGLPRWAEHG
jgi:hypothetical protein